MNKSIIPLVFLCFSVIIILIFCDKQNYSEYQDCFKVLTNNVAKVEVFVKFNYDNIENVEGFVKDVTRDIIIQYDHNYIINNYKDICYDIESAADGFMCVLTKDKFPEITFKNSPQMVEIKLINK